MLYSGVTGKITVKKPGETAVDVLHMSSWNVDLSKEIIEQVSFGNDYKEKIPSVKDWSASADGAADFGPEASQELLHEAFEDGYEVEASFYLDANTFLRGSALVESLNVSHAADGKGEVSISLAGSNAVALTVPSVPPAQTTLDELAVASTAGSSTNDTVLTISPASPGSGNKFVYKLGPSFTAFAYDASLAAGWTEFASGDNIAAGANTKVTVAEVTAGNKARGRGVAVLVKKT